MNEKYLILFIMFCKTIKNNPSYSPESKQQIQELAGRWQPHFQGGKTNEVKDMSALSRGLAREKIKRDFFQPRKSPVVQKVLNWLKPSAPAADPNRASHLLSTFSDQVPA